MGRRLQNMSIFLIVLGFCLMSFSLISIVYSLFAGSSRLIGWANSTIAVGVVSSICGFSVMLFLSFLIYLKGDG